MRRYESILRNWCLQLCALLVVAAPSLAWADRWQLPFKADACTARGTRQYSSQLMDIVGSWEAACANKPADINGQHFDKPDRCVKNAGMWGEFDVHDESCSPNWSAITPGACRGLGIRQHSGQLMNIVGPWDDACAATSATVAGQFFPRPTRCVNNNGMWGEFDVADASCAPHWGAFKAENCTAIGKRQYSAVLADIPAGTSWDQACQNAPADINGVHFDRPSRCITNSNEWGQFDVPDATCPHWGAFKADNCSLPGTRQFSATLDDIPNGMDWAQVCASTPATINGQAFAKPSRCSNQGSAMWGEFDVAVSDPACANPTSTSHSVTSHCPPGQTCVYPRPRYMNLYWSGPGQWDAGVAASGSGMTRAAIDGYTRALIRSGYFRGLAQYGVGMPSFFGSREATASCLKKFPVPNTADFVHISGFVACEVNVRRLKSTQNLIVNLFLPSTVTPEWVNATVFGQTFKWAGCESYGGYHSLTALTLIGSNGSVLPTVPFSVLPTTPACNGSLDSLTSTLSHEMVESATNPGMFGWYDSVPNDILATGLPIIEIGDICESVPLFPTAAKAFGAGKASAYWSNVPAGCSFGTLP